MAAALRRNPRTPLLLRNHFPTLSTASAPETETPPPPSPAAPDTLRASKVISNLKLAIRSESDPDRIADLFLSASHLRRFHADRSLYILSVQKLARSRRPDLIHRLLDLPSAPKSEGFLTRIMSLYATAGMLDHAVRAFDQAAAAADATPLTDRSLCALLTAFLKTRHYDRVVEAFDRVPKELSITPGLIAHNILLQALCKKGDVAIARQVLDKMTTKELAKPDIVSYTTVLEGYLSKGDEAMFEEILEEISSKGLVPNVVTYNCRITALAQKKESFEAAALLDVMESKDVPPNRASFKTIIEGLYKEGDVDAALRVFKRMKVTKRRDNRDDLAADADTYNMLIQGLLKKGELGSASDVCRECLARKLIPPFELVKGLAEGLRESSKIDEARDIVERMRARLKGDSVDAWKKLESKLSLEGAVSSQEN